MDRVLSFIAFVTIFIPAGGARGGYLKGILLVTSHVGVTHEEQDVRVGTR